MNLVWFRKDLRIIDNPALTEASKNGPFKAIFVSTPEQWRKHDMAPIQIDFLERHLNLLQNQLAELGIELVHIESHNFDDQINALHEYAKTHQINNIYANSELEVNESLRDKKILELGLSLKLLESDVIVPKGDILNGSGEMYKVFTPFRNTWLKYLVSHSVPICQFTNEHNESLPKQNTISFNTQKICSNKWPLVDVIFTSVINDFISDKLINYKHNRDIPAIKGTSGLSPYLAIGAISPKHLLLSVLARHPHILENSAADAFTWINELAWRDFYKHLLFHYPKLCKNQTFISKYNELQWKNNPEHFKLWCEGKTGYPIVDAAMRQLKKTGWMHNRLRMIVASFLTKDLLIDWKWGERFFMENLIDGDFSANNGGWQWAASTGCDAQPYFRVFNPITQSKKFDPTGQFIRMYIPELKDIPDKEIHFPHDYISRNGLSDKYYEPIVNHKDARIEALAFYKV